MTRSEFIKRMDESMMVIENNSCNGTCIAICAIINEVAAVKYQKLFRPDTSEIGEYTLSSIFWLKEIGSHFTDRDIKDRRLTFLEMFKQICLDEKIYKEF